MKRRTFLATAALQAASFSLGRNLAFAQGAKAPSGKWVQKAPVPRAVAEILGVTVNGKLYASQGQLPGFKPAGLMYEYTPAGDAWVEKKPMPHPVHHGALAAHDGKMYLFGGFEAPRSGPPGWSPVNNAWEYNPANDSWKALAPLPGPRGGAGAAVVNGKIYVVGGAGAVPNVNDPAIRPRQPQRSLATVEEYDPRTDSWRSRAPLPTACNHMGCEAVNGKLYVIGGRLSGAFIIGYPGNISLVQVYDPAADSWTTRSPMPTARSGLNTCELNGIIYTAGGEFQNQQYLAAYKAFEAYDPASDTWFQLPSMLLPRHECIMAAVGNAIHVAGGSIQSAIVPGPKGVVAETDAHEAFQLAS